MSKIFEKLDTVLLRVTDVVLAKKWYEEKLGLTEAFYDPEQKLVVFDTGDGTSLTLWELKNGEHVTRSAVAVAFPIFSTTDARTSREKLIELGVQTGEIVSDNGVTFFTFKDLDGNQLEACQVH
jgi:catechol 2,3-dioxygenase-like lactoylglutathione lyase family enzyme